MIISSGWPRQLAALSEAPNSFCYYEQKKGDSRKAVTFIFFLHLAGDGRQNCNGRAGVVQQQGNHNTDHDTDKGCDHPQAASAAEFTGNIQPAGA